MSTITTRKAVIAALKQEHVAKAKTSPQEKLWYQREIKRLQPCGVQNGYIFGVALLVLVSAMVIGITLGVGSAANHMPVSKFITYPRPFLYTVVFGSLGAAAVGSLVITSLVNTCYLNRRIDDTEIKNMHGKLEAARTRDTAYYKAVIATHQPLANMPEVMSEAALRAAVSPKKSS